jgi:hypothetical protein
MESDMANAPLTDPKVKAVEEIMNHLIMRVKNSKQVIIPHASLIGIFISERYNSFENQITKRYVSDLIFNFIFESFDRVPSD